LQCALAAARRGHEVIVCEQQKEPGGQVLLAASVPARAEFGDLVRNQLSECRRLGVGLVLGRRITPEDKEIQAADHVVVATGSRAAPPWWQEQATGLQVSDVVGVLRHEAEPAGRVLLVDETGFHDATSVAELLADRGCQVEIVTPAMVVGQDLGITLDLETFSMRAAAKQIACATDRVVMGAADGFVRLLCHLTGEEEERQADWVVLASPRAPDDALYQELKGVLASGHLSRIGDCVAPRRAHAAVIEGDRAGGAL
jgi:hypothetical protein